MCHTQYNTIQFIINAIYGHKGERKGRNLRNHALPWRSKTGSSSKDATCGHMWVGEREEFLKPHPWGLAGQGILANIPCMGGMREGVSETMLFMAISHNTIYEHTWTEKRRSKLALSQMSGVKQRVSASTPCMGGTRV